MNLKAFMIFAAILGVGYGIGFLLVPSFLISFYGPTPDPSAIVGFRYFGVALLALGCIFWLARESRNWATLRGLLLGHAIGDVAGILVSIWGTTTGIMNAFGWSVVLIYAILLAGCAYFIQLGSGQMVAT